MTERFLETLQLEECQSLSDFEVTLPGNLKSTVQPEMAWSLLLSILPRLSHNIRNFTIVHKLDLHSLQANLQRWEWDELEQLLCGLPAIEAVTIRAETTEYTTDVCEMYIFDADDALMFWKDYVERSKQFFSQRLPQLLERKLLHFEF